MLHKTRCKFYVSARNVTSTQPFENQPVHLHAIIKLNAAYSPDKSTENYSFWDATPSGTATLYSYKEDVFNDYTPGSFWYIDISEDEDGDWLITKNERHEYNINVELTNNPTGMYGGNKIEMSITNKSAWENFGDGKKYKVEFIPTVKS